MNKGKVSTQKGTTHYVMVALAPATKVWLEEMALEIDMSPPALIRHCVKEMLGTPDSPKKAKLVFQD